MVGAMLCNAAPRPLPGGMCYPVLPGTLRPKEPAEPTSHVIIQQWITLHLWSPRTKKMDHPPLRCPAPGDPPMGREVSHKSGQRRAYAQWIVTTRLLYHLHDPAELISRMQRIYPRALSNCYTSAGAPDFYRDSVANPLGFRAKGLFVFSYDVRGENRHVLAWILT